MEIVLASNAMPFGPNTLEKGTLGGSETACLMVAKEFAKMGHTVNVFTPLPDNVESGTLGEDKVRYISFEHYPNFIGNTHVDLLIVLRDPRVIATTNHARKRVLWMHDIATHRGMQRAFEEIQWTFDELWTVSEFHRQQIHEVTGYPLKNIVAMRNGIVPIDITKPSKRLDKVIAYAARPERGLTNLVDPDGIMGHLPDYTLKLSTYGNYPSHMREFYEYVNYCINNWPNVELPEELPQKAMRQRLAEISAYVYPTQFEETSCILARECVEQGTPMLTTKAGALPETLGNCGIFFEDYLADNDIEEPEKASGEWKALFADFVRFMLETPEGQEIIKHKQEQMAARTDLYWGGVAEKMIDNSEPEVPKPFSIAFSLVQDGDVIPAYAYLKHLKENNVSDVLCDNLFQQIEEYYPFILPDGDPRYMSLSDYYNNVFYSYKAPELNITAEAIENSKQHPRVGMIAEELSKLEPGSTVVEYGCGEGHVVLALAQLFPNLNFIAFDQVHANINRVLNEYPFGQLPNVEAFQANSPEEAAEKMDGPADAVICVEVLEHCVDPFSVIEGVEWLVKLNGRVIIMTPTGPWEPQTWMKYPEQFHLRNHIWHFSKTFIRDVFRGKPDMELRALATGYWVYDGRMIGNYFYCYTADHKPVNRVDPFEKSLKEDYRQTVAAAVIAYNNEDTILKMLNTLTWNVQVVQIAHGPSTDGTREVIDRWAKNNPHILVMVKDAPKIAAPKKYGGTAPAGEEFGFDDARNLSASGLDELVDWILWIDTDEYLVGHFGVYLRNNCLDGYLIPQHHFTVEPRGGVVQIDRPARLFRTGRGYRASGHIHEHFELPEGGPGHCFMLPNVDIGHTGYVNEEKRRERFSRNFPFLVWDHETNPERKLHPFLWFRDIVHRMRYAHMEGDRNMTIALAQEGERYYLEHAEEMGNYGAGIPVALQYLSEIRQVLGKGVPMEIHFKLDDREAGLSGNFLDTDELHAILKTILDPEFNQRSSRYY